MIELKLFCSNKNLPIMPGTENTFLSYKMYNSGFYKAIYLMWLLGSDDNVGVNAHIIETSLLSDVELKNGYQDAIKASISNKRYIRRIFGTAHTSGFRFGKSVPALIIYKDGKPIDVYPHAKKEGDANYRFSTTIFEFLELLVEE